MVFDRNSTFQTHRDSAWPVVQQKSVWETGGDCGPQLCCLMDILLLMQCPHCPALSQDALSTSCIRGKQVYSDTSVPDSKRYMFKLLMRCNICLTWILTTFWRNLILNIIRISKEDKKSRVHMHWRHVIDDEVSRVSCP